MIETEETANDPSNSIRARQERKELTDQLLESADWGSYQSRVMETVEKGSRDYASARAVSMKSGPVLVFR